MCQIDHLLIVALSDYEKDEKGHAKRRSLYRRGLGERAEVEEVDKCDTDHQGRLGRQRLYNEAVQLSYAFWLNLIQSY